MLSGERKGKCVDKGNRTGMDEYRMWTHSERGKQDGEERMYRKGVAGKEARRSGEKDRGKKKRKKKIGQL